MILVLSLIISKLRNILAQKDNELVLLRQQNNQIFAEVVTYAKSVTALDNELKNVSILRGPPGIQGEKGAKGLIQFHAAIALIVIYTNYVVQ